MSDARRHGGSRGSQDVGAGRPRRDDRSEENAPAAPDEPTATDVLVAAKERFDFATSAHFVLTSADLPSGRAALVGGEGVAARPPAFQGELDVLLGGGTVTVSVISVDGTVYAELSFASGPRAPTVR